MSLLSRVSAHICGDKSLPGNVAVLEQHSDARVTYHQLVLGVKSKVDLMETFSVPQGSLVGLDLTPSIEYVEWLLAILEYGAVYVVIDHNASEETTERVKHSCHYLAGTARDGLLNLMEVARHEGTPDYMCSAGFLVYSSGTTGPPKGIFGTLKAMLASYDARHARMGYPDGPYVVGCKIFFVWECLRPLLHGKTVAVLKDYYPENLSEVDEILSTYSYLHASLLLSELDESSPGVRLRQLVGDIERMNPDLGRKVLEFAEDVWDMKPTPSIRLKRLILNGERIDRNIANHLLPLADEVWNLYSISEAHDVAAHLVNGTDTDDTVGRPIDGVQLSLASDTQELLIDTPYMSEGYLYSGSTSLVPIDRPYRTGDRATLGPSGRYIINGRLKFSARIDGRTVNLEEVEAMVKEATGKESVAFASEAHRGKLVLITEEPLNEDECESIRKLAPFPQMVPNKFETGTIELLPSGKKKRAIVLSVPPSQKAKEDEKNVDVLTRSLVLEALGETLGYSVSALKLEEQDSLTITRVAGILSRQLRRRIRPAELYDRFGSKAHTPKQDLAKYNPSAPPATATGHREDEEEQEHEAVVLVTGGTGFLGMHVAKALAHTRAATIVMVRRSAERFAHTCAKYRSPAMPGIQVVVGDLGERMFGMEKEQYDRLVHRVTHVIHTAAMVDFTSSYELSRSSTVVGTRRVCNFIEHSSASLVHISTNGVFPMGYNETPRVFPHVLDDDQFAALIDQLSPEDGYGTTKWVAEGFVRKLRATGYKVHIVRPGNIGPCSKTGAISESDFQFGVFRAMKYIKKYPVGERPLYFELTPVDVLAEKCVAFMSKPALEDAVECNIVGHLVTVESVGKKLGFSPCAFGDLELPGSQVIEAVRSSPESFSVYMEDNNDFGNDGENPSVEEVVRLMELGDSGES